MSGVDWKGVIGTSYSKTDESWNEILESLSYVRTGEEIMLMAKDSLLYTPRGLHGFFKDS